MPTAQEMAMKFRERDDRLEAIAAHARGDLDAERRALDALARREREEQTQNERFDMRTESISTHGIRKGDVIWSHGMRLLVLDEPHETNHPINEYSPTLAVNSQILNWDKVSHFVGNLADRDAEGNRFWRVQGNGLARWAREV